MRVLLLCLTLTLVALAQPTLEEKACELRHLRSLHGHFQGGEWQAALDAWKGRKHELLAEFGTLLGVKGTPEARVLELLGAPDRREQWPWRWTPERGTHLLIYEWRGMHDFLYFVCDGPKVLSSGWWMALE